MKRISDKKEEFYSKKSKSEDKDEIDENKDIIFSRVWAMPNSETFSIISISNLLKKYIKSDMIVIDPFARDTKWGTITNDLDENTKSKYHMEASDFLDMLIKKNTLADVVILDPPYSPRQISECYKSIGKKVTGKDTQNSRLYKQCKDRMTKILKKGGLAITCGWNSSGFGKTRGFNIIEILLVPHGAAHNDTIITVEIKL